MYKMVYQINRERERGFNQSVRKREKDRVRETEHKKVREGGREIFVNN